MHPGIFVHRVHINPDSKEDQRATIVRSFPPAGRCFTTTIRYLHTTHEQYGNIDDQVELVAEQLQDLPELSGGFDAIGFSQGSYQTGKRGKSLHTTCC